MSDLGLMARKSDTDHGYFEDKGGEILLNPQKLTLFGLEPP